MSGTRFPLTWECGHRFVEYRLGERKVLDRIHAKVGDRNLYILGGLITIEIDGDNEIVSRDVCGWWVAKAISRRATRITT